MAGTADNEAVEEEAPPPAPPPAKRTGPMLLMIAGLAGGSLGGVAGAYLIAPRLAGAGTPQAAATAPAAPASAPAAAPESESDGSSKSDKKDSKAPSPAHIYRIDNVIVNPAGSDGTRFLMASVAYEIPDDASEQTLHAHEIQMRDDVIGILETMSMEQLTAPHARDSIKVHLLGIARRILGPQMQIDVYLPQFVIQ
jgi:flagellar protein FliL